MEKTTKPASAVYFIEGIEIGLVVKTIEVEVEDKTEVEVCKSKEQRAKTRLKA